MLINITLYLETSAYLRASTPLACTSTAISQIKLPENFKLRPISTRVEHVPSGTSTLFDHLHANAVDRRELILMPGDKPKSTVLRFVSGNALVADVPVFCQDDAARWYLPRWRKLWENGMIDASINPFSPEPQYYPELPPPESQDPNEVNAPLFNTVTTFEASTEVDVSEDHRTTAARAMAVIDPKYTVISCETSSLNPFTEANVIHRFGRAFEYLDSRTAPVLAHKSLDAFQLSFESDGANRGNFFFPINRSTPHVLPSLLPQIAKLWATGFISSP